jgi:hypothetical protein
MRTLGLIRRGSPDPSRDLWVRLATRLREEDEVIRLAVPALGWREAVALAVALAATLVVPDPLAFLIASGML